MTEILAARPAPGGLGPELFHGADHAGPRKAPGGTPSVVSVAERSEILSARRTNPLALTAVLLAWAALMGLVLIPSGSLVTRPGPVAASR